MRIERQCAFEKAERFRALAYPLICTRRASTEDVVQSIRMLGWSRRLSARQLDVERDGDAAGDLVLQREKVLHIAVELLSPQMGVGFGVDQLGIDADLVAR